MTRKGRHRRKSTRATDDHAAGLSDRGDFRRYSMPLLGASWSSPLRWYGLAVFPIGLAAFMYGLEADGIESSRLREPVPAMGEFVSAKCVTYRKGNAIAGLVVTYAFAAPGQDRSDRSAGPASPAARYTTDRAIDYRSRADCEAALPAMLAEKAPHSLWYEKSQPHTAMTTLEEPDSTRFLWVGLGALPLAGVGWWLRRRAAGFNARQSQP